MIIVDTSQCVLGCLHVYDGPELKKGADLQQTSKLLKHMFYNQLLSYSRKHKKKFGNIVLACDGKNYWRKEIFPVYKGHRAVDRQESDFNWTAIYSAVDDIKAEVKKNFPYKVLEYDRAEADDINAVLVKYLQDHELVSEGLFDSEPQPILLITSDTDAYQLHRFKNVKQWSPILKVFVGPKTTPEKYLLEHIATGDGGDNIPNVLTSDQWSIDRSNGVKPKRQKSMYAERLEGFLSDGKSHCQDDFERENWDRNELLVSFDKIPEDVSTSIINKYLECEVEGNKSRLLNYFMSQGMRQLIQDVQDF